MKRKWIFLIVAVFCVFLAGCYMDPGGSVGEAPGIQIGIKGLPSGDYDGTLFRVSLYHDGSVQLVHDKNNFPLYFRVVATQSAVPMGGKSYEEFPVEEKETAPPSSGETGAFQIEGILPGRKYRLVIELFHRDPSGVYTARQYAGISPPFDIISGGNAAVDIELTMFDS